MEVEPNQIDAAFCVANNDSQGEDSPFHAPVLIIVGHYGVGKTNFALNVAYDAASAGKKPTVIDLDVVNPYFRSSDYTQQLNQAGIKVISPVFAGSTLDVPSLSGAIYPAIEAANADHPLIIDVGGDDVGATALGRFAETIEKRPYQMLYVVNAKRNLTQTTEEAAALLSEIEERSGLKASGIVNNSHLQSETNADTIKDSLRYAESVAESRGLPLVATTIPVDIVQTNAEINFSEEGNEPKSSMLPPTPVTQRTYVVQVYVRTPWEL